MKWARVINNRVIEIINFNPHKRFVQKIEDQFVECTEETKQGHILKNGIFSEHVETLLETKQKRILQILCELKDLDRYLSRGLEDVLSILITKEIILYNDLTIQLTARKTQKEELREELQGLQI